MIPKHFLLHRKRELPHLWVDTALERGQSGQGFSNPLRDEGIGGLGSPVLILYGGLLKLLHWSEAADTMML